MKQFANRIVPVRISGNRQGSPYWIALLGIVVLGLATGSCTRTGDSRKKVIRMAITTSFRDSGLTDKILPPFESKHDVQVDLLAVGSGAALKLGENGDVDVLIVHSEVDELKFMKQQFGTRRETIFYNSYVILGPQGDPARIAGLSPIEALKKIQQSNHLFCSRGDNSGTHRRELALWKKMGAQPNWQGYLETGQGMGTTLLIASEKQAYVLCDHGTYMKFRNKMDLTPLVTAGELMHNPYSVIVVHPDLTGRELDRPIEQLVDYLASPDCQSAIADYQIAGHPLFYPIGWMQADSKR